MNSVMDLCRDALLSNGIWLCQYPVPAEPGYLGLVTKLTHAESGQWQSSLAVVPLPKADPQGVGISMTYMRRYALSAMLGIVTEEDTDGEFASFTASKAAVLAMLAQWPQVTAVLIEDKANGPAVLDALRGEVPGLIPVLPDGSKVARAYAVTPLWAGGNVWIPEDDAVWTRDFVEELVAFPAGAHDDQVDAMTQALRYLRSHGLAVWEALADD